MQLATAVTLVYIDIQAGNGHSFSIGYTICFPLCWACTCELLVMVVMHISYNYQITCVLEESRCHLSLYMGIRKLGCCLMDLVVMFLGSEPVSHFPCADPQAVRNVRDVYHTERGRDLWLSGLQWPPHFRMDPCKEDSVLATLTETVLMEVKVTELNYMYHG